MDRSKPLAGKAEVLVALAVIVCLAGTSGFGARTAAAASGNDAVATEYEWSVGLDCSICHAAQYESLGLAVTSGAGAAGDAASAEGAAGKESAANADGAANAVDTAGASDDAESEAEVDAKLEAVSAYATMHAQSLGLTCTTCHEDTDGLAKGHKKLNSGKEATRLKKSEVSSEVCLTCHDQGQLAESTADCAVLTDADGTVVNPHDLPDVADHEGVACTDCHAVHATEKGVGATAYAACVSCHHAEVFECGTCH